MPLGSPDRPSPGGRAFLIARFALYAVIIAIGGYYLSNRDSAQGDSPELPGTWIHGTTSQRLPVAVKVDDEGRVVVVDATWRATCSAGDTITWESGFVDAFEGDFEREGPRFSDDWETERPWASHTARLNGHIEGETSNGVARAGADFSLSAHQGGEVVQTCESGPIGFAVDLPD